MMAILHQIPAVVCAHVLISSTSVPLLHDIYVLMEPLTLFIAHNTQDVREPVKMIVQVVYHDAYSAHLSSSFKHHREHHS